MVEVVPIKALTVVLFGKLRQHIKHHEPVLIDNHCWDCAQRGKLCLSRLVVRRVAREDFTKAGNVEVAETINQNTMTKELSLVHVECRSENINVHGGIKHGVNNHVLVGLVSKRANGCGVVLTVHKRQLIRHALNSGDNRFRILSIHGRDGDRVNTTVENVPRKQVLHDKELIVVRARVHGIDDSSDKVSHAIPRQERLFKLLLRDRRLVELLIVHDVEGRANIRHNALEHFLLRNLGIELLNLCNIDEDFLNRFAVLKNTLLEESNRVGIHLRRKHDAANTVHQSVQEFILESRVIHDNRANGANRFNVGCVSFRNIISIIDRRIIADNIQNIRSGRGKRPNLRLNRHKHLLLSRKQVIIFFRRFIVIGFIFRKLWVCRRTGGKKTVFVFLDQVLILCFVIVTLLLQSGIRHFVIHIYQIRNVFKRGFIVGSSILADNRLKLFTS
nr:MAG TPA: hypothetical protein [Caudoviricetes sp.]